MENLDYDITQPYLGLINKYRPKPNQDDLETQRKIAKGNAVAEAFRLLIDAAGGAEGANIVERKEPANAVLGAVDKYYKIKDANRAEQNAWDKLELGTGLEALKTKSAQEYETNKQKETQKFTTSERVAGEAARAKEAGLNRELEREKLKQNADQFKQNLSLKKEELGVKKDIADKNAEIKLLKINSDIENKSYEKAIANGTFKGFSITDESVGRTFGLPVNNIPQALSFMQDDPGVKEEIGMIKARYDILGTSAEVNSMIARAFKKLSPETKDKIWTLSVGSVPFNVNSSPTPTIKTDKNSTVVQVENAPQPQQSQASPEQIDYLKKILQAKNYSPEVKRSAIFKYLVDQGYDEENAKSVAEQSYQALTGN